MRAILFLHLLGSIGMGYYLLFPFLLRKLGGGTPALQAGFAGALHTANRIGQFLLILQFLTGGYLIGKGDYSVIWIILISLLFLIIAAMAGMLGKPLKRLQEQLANGKTPVDAGKVQMFGTLIGVCFVVIIFLMFFPDLLA